MRKHQQYFTKELHWLTPRVHEIARGKQILDPFVGEGDLLKPFMDTKGYDIDPTLGWQQNDSLLNIPPHDGIILTNPPFLAKNRAKLRGLYEYKYFEDTTYDDLYKIAIGECFNACNEVLAIIPESMLGDVLYRYNLVWVNIIEKKLFEHTDCPVLMAYWNDHQVGEDFTVYKNDQLVGQWSDLIKYVPKVERNIKMSFNHPQGQLEIICYDSTNGQKIRFVSGEMIGTVNPSSRNATRVLLEHFEDDLIGRCNAMLDYIREKTQDVVLSPFKDNNIYGVRRRRLDYTMARAIISATRQRS